MTKEPDKSESVISKTAIFPGMRKETSHSFNESALGLSLREANV